MKPFLSSLFKISSKKHDPFGVKRIEDNARKKFTPSDWVIVGFFIFLTTLGALILFAEASIMLSVDVPASGGTHVEGVIGNPRFINPLLATSETDRDLTQLVFSGLLKAEPNGSASLDLAEKYEVSPDRFSYTFTLRDGITFHDGTPITADDIVFTITAAKNPDIKSPRRANWEGVEVTSLDERTVVFTLQAPFPLFLENTTIGILPRHLWESVQPEEFPFSELNTSPIGGGPYRIDDIKKNGSGVPTEYRLKSYAAAAHPAFIRTFIFQFYPNQEKLFEALEGGSIDAAHSIVPTNSLDNKVNEAVFGRVFGVFFNQNQKQIFTDKDVRQALDRSIDKNAIVSTILSGYGTPLSGPLPPTDVSEVPLIESSDASIEVAREILEEAGWERGEDGIYIKESKDATERLSFSIATSNASELKAAAEIVSAAWRELGAEVEVQLFDTNDLNLEVIRPRKYDALLFGLVIGRGVDLFAFWHSSQRNDPGLNVALYANIVTDALLEEAREEEDPLQRRAKAAEAAAEISNDVAAVFLYAPHFLYLTESKLKGVQLGTISTPSDRFFGVENWYVRTERLWPLFQ